MEVQTWLTGLGEWKARVVGPVRKSFDKDEAIRMAKNAFKDTLYNIDLMYQDPSRSILPEGFITQTGPFPGSTII